MIIADIYRPEQWHDFFLLVGTGAATLTGLIFVAMTINLSTITRDIVHKYRAISSLTGLTAVFLQCSLVMIPNQNHEAVGFELLLLAAVASGVFLYGVYSTFKTNIHMASFSIYRTIGSVGLYAIEMMGALVLILGHISGLYIAVVAMVANFFFMISGAWLLVVGPRTKP